LLGNYIHRKQFIVHLCNKLPMAQTYADRYARVLAQLIEETIGEEMQFICNGLLHDIADYKHHTGIIVGLRKCLDLMEEAETVISGGERKR